MELANAVTEQLAVIEAMDITYSLWMRKEGGHMERVRAVQSSDEIAQVS